MRIRLDVWSREEKPCECSAVTRYVAKPLPRKGQAPRMRTSGLGPRRAAIGAIMERGVPAQALNHLRQRRKTFQVVASSCIIRGVGNSRNRHRSTSVRYLHKIGA